METPKQFCWWKYLTVCIEKRGTDWDWVRFWSKT